MQRKAITDLISVIILLLITVALAGVAYSFLQGFLYPQITKSFQIPPGGSYCLSSGTGGTTKTIIVYVVNTGYQSQLDETDFNIRALDGNQLPIVAAGSNGVQTFTAIDSGKSQKLIQYDCVAGTGCGTGAASTCCNDNDPSSTVTSYSGSHTLDLGTTSGVQHISVFCP